MKRLLISEQEDLNLVKSYGFETLEEYFQYILESRLNGQRKQAKLLYNSLSTSESMWVACGREKFWEYVVERYSVREYLELRKYIIEK